VIETIIDFNKLQLLGQLCKLPCRHVSKSVFLHRLVRVMNGEKQCIGFIQDIYTLLGKYKLVGYNLTFLKDALFHSKPVWRAILRQVLQSNTQTIKKELMLNRNEWFSPKVVDTNRVSNLWSICRNSPSLSPLCRNLLRIFGMLISRQFVRQCQKCVLCIVVRDNYRMVLMHHDCIVCCYNCLMYMDI